jgi:hypothetical protein
MQDLVIRHMDEFVDELLREERICDIILPHLPVRPANFDCFLLWWWCFFAPII